MTLKTNTIIGLIFLGLLAFVYFYEIKGGEERRKEAEKSKRLVDFKDGEVQRIELVRGDSALILTRGVEGWKLNSPVVDGADQDAVERYLRNLQESEREKTIVDSAAVTDSEVVKYGLDTPRLSVLLHTEDGVNKKVDFGIDSPTDRFTYARTDGDNPEIFVLRAWRFDNLDKGVFDLRDRRVLAFARDEVMEVRRSGMGGEAIFARDEGKWQLRKPVAALADEDEINGLLDKLDNAEVEAFADEDPDSEALAVHGLDGSEQIRIELLVGQDRAEKTLVIGAEDAEGRFYARDASRHQIFLVDSTLVEHLGKSVDQLRDKEPLRFERDLIERIVLARDGERIFVAEKDTSGVWQLAEPEGRDAKSWKLNSFLTDLAQLKATGFADQMAEAAENVLDVELMSEGQTLIAARFNQVGESHYLKVQGAASIYVVDAEDFAEFDLNLDDVIQAPKEPAQAASGGGTDGE